MSVPIVVPAEARRAPCASLLLTGIAIGVQFSSSLSEALQYERIAIENGEIWRVLTCHFTHWSTDHLAWDVMAFLVLSWHCETRSRPAYWSCLILSALTIPAAIWIAMPVVGTYRGLSGIDSALFVFLAVSMLGKNLRAQRPLIGLACLAILCGFVLKIGYEFETDETLFVNSRTIGMVPIPSAHIVGAAIGGGLGAVSWLRIERRAKAGSWRPR